MQIDTGKLFEENISGIVPKENNNYQPDNNDIYNYDICEEKLLEEVVIVHNMT